QGPSEISVFSVFSVVSLRAERACLRERDRQREVEPASGTDSAFGPDASAVRLHDRLGDRQAEPDPTLAVVAAPALPVAIEDMSERGGWDPGARVLDHEPGLSVARLHAPPEGPARGRELDGIADQVGQDLPHPVAVTIDAELVGAVALELLRLLR